MENIFTYNHIPDSDNEIAMIGSHLQSAKGQFSRNLKTNSAILKFIKLQKAKSCNNSIKIAMPKLEYLRCKLIRGLKKTMRLMLKRTLPRKSRFVSTYGKIQDWNKMLEFVEFHKDLFSELSSTKKMIPDRINKSYNQRFCQEFFSYQEVRAAFNIYISILFSNFDPQFLCKQFNFQCCLDLLHTDNCLEL